MQLDRRQRRSLARKIKPKPRIRKVDPHRAVKMRYRYTLDNSAMAARRKHERVSRQPASVDGRVRGGSIFLKFFWRAFDHDRAARAPPKGGNSECE